MDEVVRAMHTAAGCSRPIEASSSPWPRPGEATLPFLSEHIPEPGRCPCAATPSAPTAASWPPSCPKSRSTSTTARSTCRPIKELARRWYPEAYANGPKKAGAHRALDDILESVQELRYYRETIFRPDVEGCI